MIPDFRKKLIQVPQEQSIRSAGRKIQITERLFKSRLAVGTEISKLHNPLLRLTKTGRF